jgi:hypothetical protein
MAHERGVIDDDDDDDNKPGVFIGESGVGGGDSDDADVVAFATGNWSRCCGRG